MARKPSKRLKSKTRKNPKHPRAVHPSLKSHPNPQEPLDAAETYKFLFDTMLQGVVIQDRDGRILEANRSACSLLGLSMDQLLGKTTSDPRWRLIHEDGSPLPPSQIPSSIALKTGRSVPNVPIGVYIPKKDEHHWILVSSVPKFHKGDRRPYVTITTFTDMTERKRTRDALREAKEYIENLIQAANIIVIGLDEKAKIIVFNEAAEKITGYKRNELEGRNWFETLVPRDRYPNVWKVFQKNVGGGLVKRFENPILSRSGEERFIAWRNSHVRQNNRIAGTVSFGLDITDRKKAEEALKTSEEKFRTLAENSADIIYQVDKDGQVVYLSPAVSRYGYDTAAWSGRNIIDFIHTDDHGKVLGEFQEALTTGRIFLSEFRILDRQGRAIWMEENGHVLKDASGDVIGLIGVLRDISERKWNERRIQELLFQIERDNEELHRLDRIKDDFLATISHELRTPLTSVIGYLRLLGDERMGDLKPNQREFIDLTSKNAARLRDMVCNLIDMSAMQVNLQKVNYSDFRLLDAVQAAMVVARSGSETKGIVLDIGAVDPSLEAHADREKLERVFINLMGNAVKFAPQGGRVEVGGRKETRDGREGILAWVKDNGPGIPKSELGKVFDRFYQVDNSITRKVGGSGLGLAICKFIVEAHGGKIWAENAPEKGACFFFFI